MGKTNTKKYSKSEPKQKNWTPFFMKMPNPAFAALKQMEKETEKTQTKIITNLLLGKGIFTPTLERHILAEAEKRGLSWAATLNEMLYEALIISQRQKPSGEHT